LIYFLSFLVRDLICNRGDVVCFLLCLTWFYTHSLVVSDHHHCQKIDIVSDDVGVSVMMSV
jgi:hypothetical protein